MPEIRWMGSLPPLPEYIGKQYPYPYRPAVSTSYEVKGIQFQDTGAGKGGRVEPRF